MQDYIECNGLWAKLWPQVKVSKKRNTNKKGVTNKEKGKQKVTWIKR